MLGVVLILISTKFADPSFDALFPGVLALSPMLTTGFVTLRVECGRAQGAGLVFGFQV